MNEHEMGHLIVLGHASRGLMADAIPGGVHRLPMTFHVAWEHAASAPKGLLGDGQAGELVRTPRR